MAYSMSFNGHDLSEYGLYVATHDLPWQQEADEIALHDLSIVGESQRKTQEVSMEVSIVAMVPFPPIPMSHVDALKLQLDGIREVLNQREDCQLILDKLPDRYWLARFSSLSGKNEGPNLWQGTLTFLAYDPVAYGVDERTQVASVDTDPDAIEVGVAFGNTYINPVYSLTAGEAFTAATIILSNDETGEQIQWTGDLLVGQVLNIDVAKWTVFVDASESMLTVSGQFPRLIGATSNTIRVYGFGILGTLTVVYRERFI